MQSLLSSPSSSVSSSTSSRLSFISTTSSLSDYSVTSLPSPPHSTSNKTHAFFSSPFPTRPPSPVPPQSKTASFFNSKQPPPLIDVSTPTVTQSINVHVIDTSNLQTPRPNDLEPSLSQVWRRTLHPAPPPSPVPPPENPTPTPDEPHPGYIISSSSLAPPIISTSPSTPTPASLSPPQQSASTTLRLLRPLGHGAFSSVWLADDLSPVPLALRSRRSLRDLRRQASSSSSSSRIKQKVPLVSLSLSRAGSLSTLRKRVPGTKPISVRGGHNGTREKLDGRGVYLDERHGQMGTPVAASTSNSGDRDHKFEAAVILAHRGVELPLSLSRSSSASSTSTSSSFSRNRNVSMSISIEEPRHHHREGGGLSRNASTGSRRSASGRGRSAKGRLVAVKMTLRGGASIQVGMGGDEGEREEREKEKERTRVAFVREVEVLRHISHPNITPLLTHLSTPTHHVLVLPYLPGGDLLALVNSDAAWSQLRESVLQRIWCEICRAVGWMHGVGLVHRDVKLENILLTTPIFAALAQTPKSHSSPSPSSNLSPTRAPTLEDLPPSPAPLIKLTDFGLSRFVDIRSEEEKQRDREARRRTRMRRMRRGGSEESVYASTEDEDKVHKHNEEEEEEEEEYEGPLLSTRCGSEAYAAPELVMGGRAVGPGGKGVYDARETDSWACGVVLYALVCRRLPFGEGVVSVGAGIKGEGADRGIGGPGAGAWGRRQWLMRIAKGEYEWPVFDGEVGEEKEGEEGEEELIGRRLVESEGARRIVERLLIRDPRKRARASELWGDRWMGGGGGEEANKEGMDVGADDVRGRNHEHEHERGQEVDGEYDFCDPDLDPDPDADPEVDEEELETEMEMEMEELEKEEEDADGWLVDQDGIDSIARREVV